MDCSRGGGEGPAILQLQKWDSSEFHLNLSEFREAFISPRRELLLLLSHQCEALLIPLINGDSITCKPENDRSPSSSSAIMESSRLDLRDNVPCTSGSDSENFADSNFPSSNAYPFVCDVNSLAWGVCEDNYDQHKGATFGELLFVSGNRGVIVHAFSQPDKSKEMIDPILDGQLEQGAWVEWGPSARVHDIDEQEHSSLYSDTGDVPDVDRMDEDVEVLHEFRDEDGDDELINNSTSKKWLNTFLTKVETMEYDGNICTRFPDKQSIPCSAKVVSFSIFDRNSLLFDLVSRSTSVSNKNAWKEAAPDPLSDSGPVSDSSSSIFHSKPDALCNFLNAGMNNSCKCLRVFSSNSHHLIGFVLTMVDPVAVSNNDATERSLTKFLLAVARIDSCGIQWLCSVKLDVSPNKNLGFDWTDFQFSEDLLLCLNASGSIFIYNAITGEDVVNLDILHICGICHEPILKETEQLHAEDDLAHKGDDIKVKHVDEGNAKSTHVIGKYGKKTFRRLIVASGTTLLAAVDECGVVYLIFASDYMPEKYSSVKNLPPHYQPLELGLVGWEVGGFDIGHQRLFYNVPRSHYSECPSLRMRRLPSNTNNGSNKLPEKDTNLQGKRDQSELPSHLRNIYLPTKRFSEDDFVWCSPLGITRLVKKETMKGPKSFQITHSRLHVNFSVNGDRSLKSDSDLYSHQGTETSFVGQAVGCVFQGHFYLVTQDGLSVILPSVAVSSNYFPVESIGYRQSRISNGIIHDGGDIFQMKETKQPWSPWKVEVLDRVLLYEGPAEADRLCIENGWDLKVSRIRRLQLALDYLKFDEIEQSIEMLLGIDLAEEGILRLVLAAAFLMFGKVGNDSEVSAASRLLGLASCFATRMIHKYGLVQYKKDASVIQGIGERQIVLSPVLPFKEKNAMESSRKLWDMSQFLAIIRNLQFQLSSKLRRPGQELVDAENALNLMDSDLPQDVLSADAMSLDSHNRDLLALPAHASNFNSSEELRFMPVESLDIVHPDTNSLELSAIAPRGEFQERKVRPLENPKDMMNRWEMDNMDFQTIVRDALLSGRLPLAVLQLHLHRSKDLVAEKESHDTFTEVRDAGRAIAYDLFLKGETGLATATLQRLGEDIEMSLKQLMFGTVRKSLRVQIAEEMTRFGYLGPYEWKLFERISVLERLYPSSSFWRTFTARQKELTGVSSNLNSPGDITLCISDSHLLKNLFIDCGEVDGVVLGSWIDVNVNSDPPAAADGNFHGGYWAAAAVWSDAWDEKTFDRIVLDQPSDPGVSLPWDSQLEYHVCHNNWEEVLNLLDMIPTFLLSSGSIQIRLDGVPSASINISDPGSSPDFGKYICSVEELDAVFMDVPNIHVLKIPANNGSLWLMTLMEQELAKKFIFMKEYWEGTAEIIPLLAQSGFITGRYKKSSADDPMGSSNQNCMYADGEFQEDTVRALHKLVVRHSVRYNLPNFLDLYLDHKMLDGDALSSLPEAAEDCQWAKWLLLSRIKGREYEASFSNSRSIMSQNLALGNNLGVMEVDDIIFTVDDIAEGGGEMAALATLMYAPVLIQNCLSSGSVNRHHNSSAQCTLENLRPILQKFPTLWRTLVASCFGQDITCNYLGPKVKHVIGNSDLSDFLNWRDNIFFSTGRDTSLLQMLPGWFPKAVRRLVQLYVQGPLGWQSLAGLPIDESFLNHDINFINNGNQHTEVSPVSWEAAIQKRVEEELYDSSLKVTGLGTEHHLHRGRPLAAFNHLLGVRIQKLKTENGYQEKSIVSAPGQTNVQSDVQALLAPVAQNEASLLSSVIPLAIMHFEDSMLVASCAFLLELCGLSASMLRVDISALKRISTFNKSLKSNEHYSHMSSKGSAFHTESPQGDIADSLAQALADAYLHHDNANNIMQKGTVNSITSKQPSRALMLVLQHLEKASLPLKAEEKTCGTWLSSDIGDGTEFRLQQQATSQHWNLVSIFCQMHHIPLSTKYLAVLARDNDWVGFLSEAQIGGYPFDVVSHVASKEFSDPKLRIHIVTVLKGMQSKKKVGSSLTSDQWNETSFLDESIFLPVELFRILAVCEKHKNPGEALLLKAKDMCWSILALVASCFPDVSSLSCLTVWLEITAARETSSIKVNDISSQIAKNAGAAVEVTNSLPAGSRAIAFHYNWRNPKRRRLMEPMSVKTMDTSTSDVTTTSGGKMRSAQDIVSDHEKEKSAVAGDSSDSTEGPASLSKMVAVLCEQHLFLPLLRAFEMFLPSCSLLPFIRALQAYSQMRLSDASAHLGSFSFRIKEEPIHVQSIMGREGQIGMSWISSTAVKAAEAMLSTCPSPYEKRCLLQLLADTDFGDGGSAATNYRRLYWKINLAEPALRKEHGLNLGSETLDDASLLRALEKNGHWEQARKWARQLETGGGPWKSAVHHVTETQAESMVAEWKEFLWDVPEERVALWGHCQMLFLRYSFPALQAGIFFLKHAEAVEKDLPAKELHDLLLLSLQWLSGSITQSTPVYPLHLLREIETRVWLLAVESEAQVKSEGNFTTSNSRRDLVIGNSSSIIDRTACEITKMDTHINTTSIRTVEKNESRENNQTHYKNAHVVDTSLSTTTGGSTKAKRRAKGYLPSKRFLTDSVEKTSDSEDSSIPPYLKNDLQPQEENTAVLSFSRWEESVGPEELERAVLSLLEFGQITAAKQLQNKLSPTIIPSEFKLVDVALRLASLSNSGGEVSVSMLDEEAKSILRSYNILIDHHLVYPLQVLETLATSFVEGSGRGLCKRIIAVLKAANLLGLPFSEAFNKQPIEVLQLLSLKAQDSFDEAKLLVRTHSMPAASIAQILAESFLKGLLAAHRGGYMDSQKEEGPAPLLWRFSDFMKWAELCPSEPEVGHALMRLVITGQEIPHACEVELLILSHHFYKSSACLDGVDVLVALAATRVETYVSEGDFTCLAHLITGVGNFYALNFILGILIENGQLDLLLQKYSAAANTNTGTAETVQGFRMAILTSLKHFNPNDLDAFSMVYNHFDMKHETASLLESRASQSSQQWFLRSDKDQNEDLLQSMRYYIEAAEVHSSIDAGNKTCKACAQASLVSLQIRMPDFTWLSLSETNARRALVEQSCFQEALIVAEAYNLNQPSEWGMVLWNQMLKPELTEEFVAEFVAVLPLQPSMLTDLSKFYRAELAARGDQSQFSVWLTGGGLPGDWAKYLGRSFRCLLKRTRDLRLRLQLATVATGFGDVIDSCLITLDKVPDTAGPLVLKKGHGGAYIPLM